MPALAQLQKELCEGSGWGQDRRAVQKLWVVFSDREDNTTYTTPERRIPFASLHFGEKVCIAEIEGDMAHVYSDEKARYPEIAEGIKSKGWVPMTNLLLWNQCPINKNGLQSRVITTVNLDRMPRDGKVHSIKYSSPDNLSKSCAMAMDCALYFLMKETDNGEYALLSSSAKMSSAHSIYGWVNKNNYVDFSQRVFIEPEWMPAFVEAHRGEKALVYGDEDMLSVITHWEYGKVVDDSRQDMRFRMPPNMLRYPVLNIPDAYGTVRCLCFGNATSYYEKFMKERTGARYNEVMEQISDKVCSYVGYVKLVDGWRYVLLLSVDELKDILETIKPIADVAIYEPSDRRAFASVVLSTVKARSDVGRTPRDEDILKLPVRKNLYAIYGADLAEMNLDDLYHYSLQQMMDIKTVSDNEYIDLLGRFGTKYRKLLSLVSNYEYRMDIQGMYYYWIPLDDMP